MLPETKTTEPYSPRARAKDRAKPVSSAGSRAGGREVVAHQYPGDDQTEDEVDDRGSQGGAEGQGVGGAGALGPHGVDEFARRQRRRLEEARGQWDQHEQAQVRQGVPETQAE